MKKPRTSNPLLLVVDPQNDFCSPSGVLARSGRSLDAIERSITNLRGLLDCWREERLPIIFTRLVYDLRKLPATHRERMETKRVRGLCAPRSKGIEFYGVEPLRGEKVIEKNFYSAFHRTPLLKELASRKIDTLYVAGMTTHVCPFLTCADAYYLGFKLVAVKDCLGTYEAQAFTLRYMREQFNAKVMTSKQILSDFREQRR